MIWESFVDQRLTKFRISNCTVNSTFVSEIGRVVLMGDAVHASKLSGGQGGSLSLEDATMFALAVAKANIKENFDDAREFHSRLDSAWVQRIDHVAAGMRMGMHI